MDGNDTALSLGLFTSVAYNVEYVSSATECGIDTDVQPGLRIVSLVKYLWRTETTRHYVISMSMHSGMQSARSTIRKRVVLCARGSYYKSMGGFNNPFLLNFPPKSIMISLFSSLLLSMILSSAFTTHSLVLPW